MILASELTEAFKKCDLNLSQQEIQQIINEVDYSQDGKINYSEFLSATLDMKSFMT